MHALARRAYSEALHSYAPILALVPLVALVQGRHPPRRLQVISMPVI